MKYKDWKVGFGGCIGLIRKLWRWCKLSLIYSFNRRQLRPNKPLITYSYQSLKQTFRSCKIMMGIAVGPLYEFKYTKPKLCLKTEKYEYDQSPKVVLPVSCLGLGQHSLAYVACVSQCQMRLTVSQYHSFRVSQFHSVSQMCVTVSQCVTVSDVSKAVASSPLPSSKASSPLPSSRAIIQSGLCHIQMSNPQQSKSTHIYIFIGHRG